MTKRTIRIARTFLLPVSAIAAGGLLAATTAKSSGGKVEPDARALIETMSEKLAAARTLDVKARRRIDAGILPSGQEENSKIHALVERPNKVHVVTDTDEELRELVYDGKHVGLVHRETGHYAYERLEAPTISEFSEQLFKEHGFQPPIAELLAGNSADHLLAEITSGRVVGSEKIGWSACTHAVFQQPGLQWDIWIADKDSLPRRLLLTFTDTDTFPRWDIVISRWRLDRPIDPETFVFRVPADFARVTMVSSDD